jgi:hypothetical protein
MVLSRHGWRRPGREQPLRVTWWVALGGVDAVPGALLRGCRCRRTRSRRRRRSHKAVRSQGERVHRSAVCSVPDLHSRAEGITNERHPARCSRRNQRPDVRCRQAMLPSRLKAWPLGSCTGVSRGSIPSVHGSGELSQRASPRPPPPRAKEASGCDQSKPRPPSE